MRIIHGCFCDDFDPKVIFLLIYSQKRQKTYFKALYIAKIEEDLGYTFKEELEKRRLIL